MGDVHLKGKTNLVQKEKKQEMTLIKGQYKVGFSIQVLPFTECGLGQSTSPLYAPVFTSAKCRHI